VTSLGCLRAYIRGVTELILTARSRANISLKKKNVAFNRANGIRKCPLSG